MPIYLPTQWLWDIVDEFIWQFGAFSACKDHPRKHMGLFSCVSLILTGRSRTKDKTEDEIMLLDESPQVWSCYSVLNVLYSLVQKSRIQEILKPQATESPEVNEYAGKNLYKMLCYFSILGLLRVHVLLGDYTLALKCLDDIGDLKTMVNPATRFHTVHAAHVAVFYYVGFAYLMMQRFSDAVEVLGRGVGHFYKNRRFTFGADQVGDYPRVRCSLAQLSRFTYRSRNRSTGCLL